jgi:hypothetical protein
MGRPRDGRIVPVRYRPKPLQQVLDEQLRLSKAWLALALAAPVQQGVLSAAR